MALVRVASAFALLVMMVSGAENVTANLVPVLSTATDVAGLDNLIPSTNISLSYGVGSSNLVNVSLLMVYPTVVLEYAFSVVDVSCAESTVSVVFGDAAARDLAVQEWIALDDFVLITNHLGNCDLAKERGVFLADDVTWDPATLTVVVNAMKKDLSSTAGEAEISFSNLPLPDVQKRDSNDQSLIITRNISLPADLQLFSYAPYFAAFANEGKIDAAVTLSGHVKYNLLTATLEQLHFDIDTSVAATLGLTLNVTAPYTNTFTYSPGDISYSFVNVPGIINIGPALIFDLGVDLAATAAVSATTDVSVGIADGRIHLDFLNSSLSSATGWTPTHSSRLNTTEKALLHVNPFIDVTVELAFNLFSGAVDLSAGITAQPKFINAFTLTAQQDLAADGAVSQPTDSLSCAQGIEVKSDFVFSVVAFVTQWWKQTLYKVEVPIAEECYTWI